MKGYSSRGCLVCGRENLSGLRATFKLSPEGAWTEVTTPVHLQGFDGTLHGGVIAALLDDTMWYTAFGGGYFTMTAELSVRYKKPVPIGIRVRTRGRVVQVRGRLVEVSARMEDADSGLLFAEASGKFLCVPEEMKVRLGSGDIIDMYDGQDAENGCEESGAGDEGEDPTDKARANPVEP